MKNKTTERCCGVGNVDGDDCVDCPKEYVCAIALFLADGTAETQVLHRGPWEDCQAVYELCPATTYSGARPIKAARLIVREAAEWDAIIEDMENHGR